MFHAVKQVFSEKIIILDEIYLHDLQFHDIFEERK